MSTILDALRKVAEEQHTQGVDVRTRLLSFPSRLDPRARRRPGMGWLVSAGVAIIGFSAGAGLMYWRSHSPGQEEQPPTLASSAAEATPTATRAPVPSVLPALAAENHSPRTTPEQVQNTPPTASPLPSAASAPALPPPLPVMKDRLTQEPRLVPRSAPPPLRKPTPMSAVRPELAVGTPPLIPPMPFDAFAPTAPRPIAPMELPGAAVTPFPEAIFGGPGVGTRFPPQPPPVVDETTTVQSDVSLSLLQWSPDADKRMAFLRVKGGPLTLAHEGDTVAGLTVTEISSEAVTLRSGDKTWVLQVR